MFCSKAIRIPETIPKTGINFGRFTELIMKETDEMDKNHFIK
jgi:hypothetical protein